MLWVVLGLVSAIAAYVLWLVVVPGAAPAGMKWGGRGDRDHRTDRPGLQADDRTGRS